MKIAIISAMEKERSLIAPMLDNKSDCEFRGLRVTQGVIGKKDIVLARCGIGKVNAAINTYKVITDFRPDILINTGVAGGASMSTEVGDILVADYVAYHDVWCGPGTQPGVADGMDVFMRCNPDLVRIAYETSERERGKKAETGRMLVGLICSGDRFISEPEEVIEIRRLFPEVLAVDMESAAIAQVCSMERVAFNIIRVVSDTPGSGRNMEQYKDFWTKAPEKTFSMVESILQSL